MIRFPSPFSGSSHAWPPLGSRGFFAVVVKTVAASKTDDGDHLTSDFCSAQHPDSSILCRSTIETKVMERRDFPLSNSLPSFLLYLRIGALRAPCSDRLIGEPLRPIRPPAAMWNRFSKDRMGKMQRCGDDGETSANRLPSTITCPNCHSKGSALKSDLACKKAISC